ncbi:MAG: cytochrome c [Chlorobiaceae bacterium]|nr:cytochrome c [Chlorobiaceae bacterium]
MNRFNLSIFLFGLLFLKTEPLVAATDDATGQQLFDRHCSVCHSMQPPPKTAPPVLGIALHYREAFGDKTQATEHMVKFMQKPDPALSKLEPAAVRRFGLMPAMSMTLQELRKVAVWLWDSYDPQFKTPGNCR